MLVSLGKREQLQAALSAAKLAQTSAQKEVNDLKRLAELGRSQADQALADAKKALPDAQKVYDDVFTDDFNKKIDDKEVAVQSAKDKLKDAQEALDKYTNLEKDNQTRKDAQKTFDNAQRDTNNAMRERDLLKNQQDQAKAAAGAGPRRACRGAVCPGPAQEQARTRSTGTGAGAPGFGQRPGRRGAARPG